MDTPCKLNVTAAAQTKTYGDADPSVTYRISGLGAVGWDTLTGGLVLSAGSNVGTYGIDQGTLAAGSNYGIVYTGANLTITQRSVSIYAISQTVTDSSSLSDLSREVFSTNGWFAEDTRHLGFEGGGLLPTQTRRSAFYGTAVPLNLAFVQRNSAKQPLVT